MGLSSWDPPCSLPWSEGDSVSRGRISVENQERVRAVENSIWGEGFGAQGVSQQMILKMNDNSPTLLPRAAHVRK